MLCSRTFAWDAGERNRKGFQCCGMMLDNKTCEDMADEKRLDMWFLLFSTSELIPQEIPPYRHNTTIKNEPSLLFTTPPGDIITSGIGGYS